MKKLTQIVLVLLLVLNFSNAETLKSFTDDYTSRTNNQVMLDKKYNSSDIKINESYHTANNIDELNQAYKLTLVDNGYLLQLDNNIMYVTNTSDTITSNNVMSSQSVTNQKQYTYDLKYITSEDIQNALTAFSNVSIQYLKSYNKIVFSCDEKDKNKLLSFLQKIDIPIRSKNIKITVFNSSDDVSSDIGMKINKLGVSLNSNVSNYATDYFNSLFEFDAYISALKNDNKISISQAPTFFLINGNKLSFKSVKNIPFLTQSSTVENTGSSTTNTYNYKDVGLQVEILPRISKQASLLDINIKIEDLIDLNSDKPLTNRLEYQNIIVLGNAPVLLTGLKKTTTSKNVIAVPLLSDVPFFGNFFKFTNNIDNVSNMSILIEFIPNTKDN